MDFTDQMAAKLLAQTVRTLGQALNETLCVTPDKGVVRLLLDDARRMIEDFEEAYFDSTACGPGDANRGTGGGTGGAGGGRQS